MAGGARRIRPGILTMDALIGHTGFVGSTIARQRTFDAKYHSRDITSMTSRQFDTCVCAGVRAEKWKANRDPQADKAGIEKLVSVLETVRIRHLILISTVDVYPVPVGVDETSPIDVGQAHPYGRHRLELERRCTDLFDCTIVRLPALFGRGLKKNALFDLLHDNEVEKIHPDSTFQFYDVARVWSDVERVCAAGIALANLTTQPLAMRVVAEKAFARSLFPGPNAKPAHYDVRSKCAAGMGGRAGYWYDSQEVLSSLTRFVAEERERMGLP